MMQPFFGIDIEHSNSTSPELASKSKAQKLIFDFLIPKPSPFKLIRLGGSSDGSYLVPDCIHMMDACFSPGVANRKDFEDSLYLEYGVRSHMCDYSSDIDSLSTALLAGQSFKKLWLDVDSPNSISLQDWVAELEPHSNSLILQMDIEGAEYRNILRVPPECLSRFQVCIIELHGLAAIEDDIILFNILSPFFHKLSQFFTCVHAHPNNCSSDFYVPQIQERFPHVLEITLISNSLLQRIDCSSEHFHKPIIPHPLDVVNVSHQPPIFLSGGWLANCSELSYTLENQYRQQKQILDYYQNPQNFCKVDRVNSAIAWLVEWSDSANTVSMYAPSEAGHNESMNDISLGKTFTCTSTHESRPLGHGKLEGKSSLPFFFHTSFSICEGILIDLGKPYTQALFLEIVNRYDCCQERAGMLFLHLSDIPPDLTELPPPFNSYRISTRPEFLQASRTPFVIQCPVLPVRYIFIFSLYVASLHFASLRVLAQDGQYEI